jgi:hypothetical protein
VAGYIPQAEATAYRYLQRQEAPSPSPTTTSDPNSLSLLPELVLPDSSLPPGTGTVGGSIPSSGAGGALKPSSGSNSSRTGGGSQVREPDQAGEGGSSSSNGGLPTSTAIGLAVGLTLGILLIVWVVLALFIRRRRRERTEQIQRSFIPLDLPGAGDTQLFEKDDGKETWISPVTYELDAMPAPLEPARRHELAGAQIVEAPGAI